MIKGLKKFFEVSLHSEEEKKSSALAHDKYVATCALFLEMANIDGEFSEIEKERILSILIEKYDLSKEYAHEITEAASEELKESIHLWEFTNLVNENYSKTEKLQIIGLIWEIVYSDGKLDKHEDYLIHKLAKLLNISHRELIEAKLMILKKLRD